ncbi:AAA family ATPase [Niastella yeongjuensis]|uniref:AAA family ATPase n=1 Tax=Niastella yeongjuensis TaxID=354355 RepID=A0A1V9EXX7_9BACT|nr:AAA family ATPase [Niastella yeongjuensis]OQP50795.1 AAA family ATPase [Niastella yeongjuensis]SEN17367.1 ATPase family associated with various cellular activities (AAA) [Niastella yeongjuensis]
MDNLITQKVINANSLFDHRFLDANVLYMYHFNRLPSVNFISRVDGEKLFNVIKEKYGSQIKHIHQRHWYKKSCKRYEFDRTVLVFEGNRMVEVANDYCEIMHDGSCPEWVITITELAGQCKERQRRQPFEINLIVQGSDGLELKAMETKRTKLDIDLFYEDDFRETDEVIRQRLNKKNDKGIVLLHGLPGTGKTTYLRYLIGKVKKRVLFLSPGIACNLMDPNFIDLLVNNPNTVVVIEDAENIIMDRRYNSSSSVSNLLNISDGLLADFLNVQLICTFNNSLTMVDSALMRKGRLIAKYEFGKLSAAKAQRLSKHLGLDTTINQPMTIAEIANPHEKEQPANRVEVIGFRQHVIQN